MTLNEKRDLRNKLMKDAQELLLSVANPDAELRAKANAMVADADNIESDIVLLEKLAKAETEERSRTAPNRGVPGATTTKSEDKIAAEKRAFSDFIRFGSTAGLQETRELTTSNSGYLVPQAFYPILTEAQKSFGQILNVITQQDADNGAPMKYSTVSDVANVMTVLGEGTTDATEVDPTSITGAIINTDFCTTGVILISLPELQDSQFDLDSWIKSAFGKRYFRGMSNWVTNGNSSNIGSLKTSATVGHTTASTTVIAWADVAAMYGSLDPAYEGNAKWSLNTTTRAQLLGVVDSLGRPLYVPAVTAESFDMLLGRPVILNQFLDNPGAGNIPVMYGDHSAYLLRNVKPGLSITRLSERYLPSGNVGFIGFSRNGGALLQSTIPPVISLAMHA